MTTPIFIKAISPAKPKAKPAVKHDDVASTAASGKFAGLLAILADHNPKNKFGPDKVKPGHSVTFKAGTFAGGGKVTAAGKHGVTVEDDDARAHSVHWHEITGHVGDEDEEGDKDGKPKGNAKK
jgi:hypothetical protein